MNKELFLSSLRESLDGLSGEDIAERLAFYSEAIDDRMEDGLTEEEAVTASEIKTVIDDYITVESAKFITGARPISEIDQFYEELKAMDVEEYIEIYVNAYSTYMDAVFN